jgi:hypothetical protein
MLPYHPAQLEVKAAEPCGKWLRAEPEPGDPARAATSTQEESGLAASPEWPGTGDSHLDVEAAPRIHTLAWR